ncbi:MAG TPA: glutathione peroxidase [Burkholderiales bacterium]|nr:glutathione peroxidase [Burkholderiales bacterium]
MRFVFGFLLSALVSSPVLAACPPLLEHTFPSLTDRATPLCQFQGKVLLVVNTASECGYTPQYEGLEALYRRYREKGLVVLGFPANDFGGQEPGGNRDIAKFCEVNYGVSFPMFAKSEVVGGHANPLFATLAAKTGERPHWNFHKYLVDRSGEKVASYSSEVTPDDRRLVADIERMLSASAGKP